VPRNQHPTDKQGVRAGLARASRHAIHGEAIAPSELTPRDAARRGDRIVVGFSDVEAGLVAGDAGTFALAPHTTGRFGRRAGEGSEVSYRGEAMLLISSSQ
jgi:hypothetical protein